MNDLKGGGRGEIYAMQNELRVTYIVRIIIKPTKNQKVGFKQFIILDLNI